MAALDMIMMLAIFLVPGGCLVYFGFRRKPKEAFFIMMGIILIIIGIVLLKMMVVPICC